jgi:hypothetical protein
MPGWQSGAVTRCLHQALPVLWPSEWRVTMTRSGLYLVEADTGDGWWLERMCFRLGDAFALGETLHGGPRHLAAAHGAVLPEIYRVPTGEDWQGNVFRGAVEDNPFSLDLRPEDAFASRGWTEALTGVLSALKSGRNVVVTGAKGAGKTLFLRELARRLPSAVALRPGETPAPGGILLIDDAATWTDAALAALFATGLPIVLATEPEAAAQTCFPDVVRLQLSPLSVEEVARFMVDRLRAGGRPANWPEPEAVLALFEACAGIPRDLIMLAGAAAFLADLEHAPRLSALHVEHAVAIARAGTAQLMHPATSGAERAWLQPRLLRIAAACAGFAFVIMTSWGARWVGREAELAQLEQQRTPLTVAAAAPAIPAPAPAPAPASAAPAAAQPVQTALAQEPGSDEALEDNFDSDVAVASAPDPREVASAPSFGMRAPSLVSPASLGSFRGPVNNETLRLTGKLELDLARNPLSGTVRARFHAWNGLLGTGQLQGTMTSDGRVTLQGQLLMGKNPFLCTLTGTIHGDHFTGSAQFVRPWGGPIAYSSFSLIRA